MALVIRHTAVWTGAPGLPGYSQFYQASVGDIPAQAQSGHDDLKAFFGGLESFIPEEVTVTVDPIYQTLDVVSGALNSEGTVGSPSVPTVGLMVGGWNAQVGILVEWLTSAFVNSRRLRGRTYLVPLGDVSQADGTVPELTLTTIRYWAGTIITEAHGFVVWHRPVSKLGGMTAPITSRVVRDHAAILRSRMV